jgi:hypothetical protein
MIELLDRALRTLFLTVPGLHHESQIRFQPPDDRWRAAVTNLQVAGQPAMSLNVYLTELRQDRERRSTERPRTIENGRVVERLAPGWIECAYLISAWSPAVSEQVEPTMEEHALLYAVLAVLQDTGPITPSRIHPAGSSELTAWQEFRDIQLPTELLPVDGFAKLPEFWGTMGQGHRWKPVVQLTVGLPVVHATPVERGRPAVTVVLGMAPPGGQADVRVTIGGRVRRADGVPVGVAAEVSIVAVAGPVLSETVAERDSGRFLLELPIDVVGHPDRYRLRARLPDAVDVLTTVDWRAPSHDIVIPSAEPVVTP